ncbi:MAG: hypothetical protein CMM83_01825 [Rhodospirillales bacterium]|nr:hypothetical protein [Rhodospirillales bacterium]
MSRNKNKRWVKHSKASSLSPDDDTIFLEAMRKIKEIPCTVVKEKIESNKPHQFLNKRNSIGNRSLNLEPLSLEKAGDIDKRTLARLRRGQLRPEARLDLHGMTRGQAYKKLMTFLQDSQALGKRCVIIITGRGRLSQGGGVLKRETPDWLNSPQARSRVLAISVAAPCDGGAGALYVMLRRLR